MYVPLLTPSRAFVLHGAIRHVIFNSAKNSVTSSPTSALWVAQCFKETGQTAWDAYILHWPPYLLWLTALVLWHTASSPPHTVLPTLAFPFHTFSFFPHAAAAKSLQSCPTLCDPMNGSPPGSPVPGILQARTLEWVAISSSNAWKWKVKVKSLSCVRLPATPWTAAYQAPPSMGFSRQEYWSRVPLIGWL